MLLANRFTIDPVAVILSLIFWYWMWGDPGGADVGNHQDRLRSTATVPSLRSSPGRMI
jgi:hypothetical protein